MQFTIFLPNCSLYEPIPSSLAKDKLDIWEKEKEDTYRKVLSFDSFIQINRFIYIFICWRVICI